VETDHLVDFVTPESRLAGSADFYRVPENGVDHFFGLVLKVDFYQPADDSQCAVRIKVFGNRDAKLLQHAGITLLFILLLESVYRVVFRPNRAPPQSSEIFCGDHPATVTDILGKVGRVEGLDLDIVRWVKPTLVSVYY
jgi:hypothetical protein